MDLTAAEARVLGCLIEHQVAAPEERSVSLDELRFACNQTRGRHPVVAYDDRAVEDTLLSLKSKGLARFVLAGRTTGPVHYRHRADERWRLSRPELAVLAVLLLRGPQTLRQVHSALADNPIPVDDPFDVEAVLDALAGRTPTPLARRVGGVAPGGEQRWSEALTAAGRRSALSLADLPGPPEMPDAVVPDAVVADRPGMPPRTGPAAGHRAPGPPATAAAPGGGPVHDGRPDDPGAGIGAGWRDEPGARVGGGGGGGQVAAEPLPWGTTAGSLSGGGGSPPGGRPSPSLADLADRLANIERRLAGIEAALGALRAAVTGSKGTPSPPHSASRAHR
jgi:uncharacterized protein YceH (UPF0502 family)